MIPTQGEKAASVYCDVLARDMALTNQKLLNENTQWAPFLESLTHLELYTGTREPDTSNVPIIIDLSSFQFQSSDYEYNVSSVIPDTPLDEIHGFRCKLSGLNLGTRRHAFTSCPRLSIDKDNMIHMEYQISEEITLTASVVNCQGTTDELRHTIENNYYTGHFSTLGMQMFTDTGEPFSLFNGTGHVPLNGAICQFRVLSIKKAIVQPVLAALAGRGADPSTGTTDAGLSLFDDTVQLATAFPNHAAISEVTREYKKLSTANQELTLARNIYQSVGCYNDDDSGEPVFSFDLIGR
jgi:hypothetical protein